MQRIITLNRKTLLALVGLIILGLCAVEGHKLWIQNAAEKNFSYEVYDDHVELLEYSGNEKNIVVPDTLMGKPVTVLKKRCFYGNRGIKTVRLGRNIREIEEDAFKFCFGLEHVTGKAELETISESTFSGCLKLKTVAVGNHVKRIEKMAFWRCYVLNSIGKQPELEYIGLRAFKEAGILNDFQIPEHAEVEREALYDSSWLYSRKEEFVVLGAGCLVAYNGDLEIVEVPQGVTKLDGYVFTYCAASENIKEIRLPETVTEVATRAFDNCGKIKVYIPESVTAIDTHKPAPSPVRPNDTISYLGAEEVTIVTTSGSYAEEYAKTHNIKCEIVEPW